MTVSTATSRSGPYAGAGTTGPFTVNFRFLDAAHLEVIRTDATGDHVLVLSTDYTVAGVGNPTGSVTLLAALPSGQTLTIIRDVPVTQEADYVQNDDFPAESHENVVDKLTMVAQQLAEAQGRALTLAASSSSGVSTKLPLPESNKLIGWNAAADGLQNMDGSSLATVVAFGTAQADLRSGNGVATVFALTASPGAIANLDVSIGGVTQRPGSDYTWVAGTSITFISPPPVGTNNILIRYMQGLPQGVSDSAAAQFVQAGAGAVIRNAQNKMRESVSLRDFGCALDGVTDDSAGFWAAVTFAKSNGYRLLHPGGVCRVTYGMTQNVQYDNIFLVGSGRANEPASPRTSVILLDSANPASYFLNIATNTTLVVEGITFKCAQYVAERPFFKFSASLHFELMTSCVFEAVERPIVWASGSYFQNAAFRDICFRNSGTFHSECPNAVGQLIGTFLVLDNINHEGSVPANAEKYVCNLRGIRQLEIGQFVNEGSLPAAGWTPLLIANPYDAYYTRTAFGQCANYHTEWTGFSPAYCIEQVGGTFKFDSIAGIGLTNKYKLSSSGRAIVEETAFTTNSTDEATQMFDLADNTCIVQLDSCSGRTLDLTKAGFIQKNAQWANPVNGAGQVVVSNDAAQEIWRWNGAMMDGSQALLQSFGGAMAYSTDAVYGRKLVITPAAGSVNVQVTLKAAGMLVPGDQLVMSVRAKLPTFAAGLWGFNVVIDGGGGGSSTKYYDTTFSGLYVDVLMPIVLLITPNTIGFNFSNGTTGGVATNLEILSMVMYHGNSVPRRQLPCYPKCTTSFAPAAPLTGTWAQGDRVVNSAPAVGSPKAWACTVAGTPGTWVSEGNL